jgi:KGK domain
MNNEFKALINGEILSLKKDVGRYFGLASNGFADAQIKAEQLAEIVKRRLNVKDAQGHSLFGKGIDCEVVKLDASGWQKGKLRAKVILEFCPDEPPVEEKPIDNQQEPPLDDLRRLMGEDNF